MTGGVLAEHKRASRFWVPGGDCISVGPVVSHTEPNERHVSSRLARDLTGRRSSELSESHGVSCFSAVDYSCGQRKGLSLCPSHQHVVLQSCGGHHAWLVFVPITLSTDRGRTPLAWHAALEPDVLDRLASFWRRAETLDRNDTALQGAPVQPASPGSRGVAPT